MQMYSKRIQNIEKDYFYQINLLKYFTIIQFVFIIKSIYY